MLLIVVLHNRLCYINKKTALISMISTGLFCLLIAFYCLNSGNLDLNIIALFSDLIFLFKILLAAYLLITSYYAVKNDYLQANLLFYSEIFFACACIWDRVFINYEPIYGIRFIEGGILVVIYSIAILLWKNIIKTYTLNLAFIEEYRQITKQLDIQQAYTLKIKEVIDEKRRLIHDFKHHLCVIDNMAKQTNQKNIIEYISNTNEFIDTSNNFNIIFTNNVAVDALLQYYAELCQKQNIKLSLNLSLPEASPLNDVEWCIILGNLLENSITACFQQKDTHKFIQINSKETEHTFYLVFKNSYNGKIRKIGSKYLSLKDDPKQHGIGLESIKSIIYKYQGTVDIYADNKLFNVGITIPISSKLSK
ncbi:ATP-binding protein [[Clostridium] saccharogumia]|uniref:sensor histidine kinase n=1 Tax=Thomasclavelia saccharogumia TaxID=341225 RepID=UPI001D08417F|nr:ATP-binding protein [Thomasclavelia saccharogumia]MCB6706378.1 ATP-binding protein [Thomasclavelia saccharogumia]